MRKLSTHKKLLIATAITCALIFIAVAVWYISGLQIDVLNPKGIVATKQYELLVFTTLLGFLVVVPVFIMTILIAWRYRESNTKAKYTPNKSTNHVAETIWWSIPIILITVLSVVTWNSTHELDPHKPLASDAKPITIQVVALDWKWLFIYPEENIATVNFIQFPVDHPVNFQITSDAPMNSFWIPQLAGQIYAMPGMTTKLHLNATEAGSYKGLSANISGEGFADMKFTAKASTDTDYRAWLASVKQSDKVLTEDTYADLAVKSIDAPVTYYASSTKDLYDTIVMKYMMPESPSSGITNETDTRSLPNTTQSQMDTYR